MLNAARALVLNADAGKLLPEVEGLKALYRDGAVLRQGQVIMIAGRSGTQKSGFALWLTREMGLPTLYFSADMSAFTAATRVACMVTGATTDGIETAMRGEGLGVQWVIDSINEGAGNLQFAFGKITWESLDAELEAYIELWGEYPKVIVIDNLMDIDGCSSDYVMQMEAMDIITDLARNTGATVLVLHHASDKSWEAKSDPWAPPSRDQIKNGLAEKPEMCLTVALNPKSYEYHIAIVKQRMGRQDPTAQTRTTIRAYPEQTRFGPYEYGDHLESI